MSVNPADQNHPETLAFSPGSMTSTEFESTWPSDSGFELREQIGSGGMGVVYRAQDLNLRREVAIKLLQSRFAPDSSTALRFTEEAQITAQLQHPGVPAVYAVAKLPDGRPYLAMKLIKGQTLEFLLSQPRPINLLAIFEAICQTVGYAHAHNVIHRDLKPANIMVGAFGEVQVMDWGLAKVLGNTKRAEEGESVGSPSSSRRQMESSDPNSTVAATHIQPLRDTSGSATQAGSVMGTPSFMPPEQARGEIDEVDQRSDVFGLGAILCCLLTGLPPYRGNSAIRIREMAWAADTADAFHRLNTCGADAEVIHLCQSCLAVDPSARPADANAVVAIVATLRAKAEERLKQAELARTRAEVVVHEAAKRRRLWNGALSIISIILALGVTVSLWQVKRALTEASNARTAEGNAEQQKKAALLAQGEAEKNEALARERTQKLQEQYGQFVFGIQNKLETRPGTQDLRRELLLIARNGLQKILQEARALGQPDHTMVWSYIRLGDLEQQLGNSTAAMREYQAGHEIANRLASQQPDQRSIQQDLATSHQKLGDLALLFGEAPEANEHFRKMNAILEKLIQLDPANDSFRADLGVSYSRIGDLALREGKPQAALASYQKSVQVAQELLEKQPASLELIRRLITAQDLIGKTHAALSEWSEMKAVYQKSLRMSRQLVDKAPTNTVYQRDLAISYDNLGNSHKLLNEFVPAKECYQNSLTIRERLAKADPQNADVQRDLSISYVQIGMMTLEARDYVQARQDFVLSSETLQRLAEQNPRNTSIQRDLSTAYERLRDLADRQEHWAEAMTWVQKSLNISERLTQQDPTNLNWQTDLMMSYSRLGDLHRKNSDFTAAVAAFTQADQLAKGLAKTNRLHGIDKDRSKSIADELHVCRVLERGLTDLDVVFQQPPREIARLIDQLVRALLKRKQTAEASRAARRYAAWTNQPMENQHEYRSYAGVLLALCAAAHPEQQRDELVQELIQLLRQNQSVGYYGVSDNLKELQNDKDYDGIRAHSKWKAFLKELAESLELAPPPRPKS